MQQPSVIACTGPNIAFVDVLLPESATPIQPNTGANTTKNSPIFESPKASELAIPGEDKRVGERENKKRD